MTPGESDSCRLSAEEDASLGGVPCCSQLSFLIDGSSQFKMSRYEKTEIQSIWQMKQCPGPAQQMFLGIDRRRLQGIAILQ